MKIPSGSARRKYTHAENSKENACGNVEKKTCAVSEGSFLHEEGALGRATTSRGCKAGWGDGKREGGEWGREGNEEEGSEVRQRELAACKNLQSKNEIRNRKRNSKLGLGRLATAQQAERRERKREEGECWHSHNSADKGALLLLINFIAEIRQCCTLYKHTHTHTQHVHSNYTKETTWESCKLRSCSPSSTVCVCFSVRNFHAKSNAILGKSFSKNTKSSSADDPHVIHQRQCPSAKLTIQSRQLRR